jgi:galactitol-specific phosphotransferase system IIB component
MDSKWDIEKFTGDNDFGLWRVKMEAVLIQKKCEKALKGEGSLPVAMSQEEKTEMVDKAKSAVVLCLGNKVSREVGKDTTAASMWSKFEYLYMTNSLAHRQFLKQQLYSFKMVKSKAIMELLVEFNKIIGDLENIEVRLEDAGALIEWCCFEDEGDIGHLVIDA